MHVCIGKLTIIGSDNGLTPGQRQAIIRTNAGFIVNSNLRKKLQWNLSEIQTFSFKKMHLTMSSRGDESIQIPNAKGWHHYYIVQQPCFQGS